MSCPDKFGAPCGRRGCPRCNQGIYDNADTQTGVSASDARNSGRPAIGAGCGERYEQPRRPSSRPDGV